MRRLRQAVRLKATRIPPDPNSPAAILRCGSAIVAKAWRKHGQHASASPDRIGEWHRYCLPCEERLEGSVRNLTRQHGGRGRRIMKIAIATKDWQTVSGHAGKACCWLLYEPGAWHGRYGRLACARARGACEGPSVPSLPRRRPPPPRRHRYRGGGQRRDGFIRHMQKRGVQVLLTGETDPAAALTRILAGEALPDRRFDITATLCKLRDLFSHH